MKLILTVEIRTAFTSGGSGAICMFTDTKTIDLTAKDIVDLVNYGRIQIQNTFYKIQDLSRLEKDVLCAFSFQELSRDQHNFRYYKKLKAQGMVANHDPTDIDRIQRRGHKDFRP